MAKSPVKRVSVKKPSSVKKASTTVKKKIHAKKGAIPSKGGTTKKEPFDKTAFVFNTDTKVVVEAMERLYAIDDDENEYPYTEDELYWLSYWAMTMPKVLEMNIDKVPLCAIEAKVLGIYKNELVDLNRKRDY